MKKIILIGLFFLLYTSFLFGNDSVLSELIKNGYYNIAAKYCENVINKPCLNLLFHEKKYYSLIKNIDENSGDPDLLILLAHTYIELKRFDKAYEIINKIKTFILNSIQKKELNDLINLIKAETYYENFNYQSAFIYYSKINTLTKEELNHYLMTCIFTDHLNEAEKAIKKYKIKDYFYLGLIEYKKGNYHQAILYLEKSKRKDAKDYLYNALILTGQIEKAFKLFPQTEKYKTSFFKNIKVLIKYRKFEEALYRLKGIPDSFEKYFYTGKIFLLQGKYLQAINNFLSAKKFKNNGELNFYLGYAYFYNGDYLNSQKYFQYVIEYQDNPEYFVKALYLQGLCFEKIGKFENAIKNLAKILTLSTQYISVKSVYKNLAICYEKIGDYSNSIEYYLKFYNLQKDKKILLKIADIAIKNNDYNYALEIYRNFLPVKKKKDIFILKKIGDIYFNTGNYKESAKFYKNYIRYNLKNYTIILKIGLSYLYSNNLKKAKDEFIKVIELSNNPDLKQEALYWVGLIYYRQKKYLKSNVYFLRLYHNYPESYLSQKAIKYIVKNSIALKDSETLKEFVKFYHDPQIVPLLKSFCNNKKCLKNLTIQPQSEIEIKLFNKLNILAKQRNIQKIEKLIKNYKLLLERTYISYFKIAEILGKNNLKNLALFYYNKFLTYPYNPAYSAQINKALLICVNYATKSKDYEKITTYEEKFKNTSLPNFYNFIFGEAFYKIGISKKAKIYLTKYIENFSYGKDNVDTLFQASYYLDEISDYKEALKGYKLVLKYSKNKRRNVEILYRIGELLYRENNKLEALKYFFKIRFFYKEYSKWNIQAAFRAGNILEEFGDKLEAIREYKYIYYRLENSDPRKIYIAKKLKELQNENN